MTDILTITIQDSHIRKYKHTVKVYIFAQYIFLRNMNENIDYCKKKNQINCQMRINLKAGCAI